MPAGKSLKSFILQPYQIVIASDGPVVTLLAQGNNLYKLFVVRFDEGVQ